ncbi:POM121-like protein 12 [Myotis myotis]|nr:POM121-like protein 12 [Myotis myotis]
MGSCLSSPQPASPPRAQVRPARGPPGLTRAQDGAHRGRRVSTGPFPQVPRDWMSPKPGEVMEALRYLRAQSPPETTVGPGSYEGCGLWSAQHPRRLSSLVTIKIASPERQGRPCAPPEQGAPAAGSPPTEDHPGPVAKETVMRAPSGDRRGNRKFDEPLWFENQGRKIQTRDLEPRPSAFKPLVGAGAVPCFSPRPGPLSRSRCPWSYNVHQEVRAHRRAASPLATAPGQGAEPQLDT